MYEYVCLAHLIESRFERLNKVCGELANETYRIAHQERQIVDSNLADCGIESSEELILGKHIAFAQEVHQSRFSDIGIANESHTNEFASILALSSLLAVNLFEFFLQQGNTVEHYAAVCFDLGLTRSTHTDTALLSFEVSPKTCETRQEVLVLGKFNLCLGSRCLSSAGKDVENEACAVEDLPAEFLFDDLKLLRTEIIVEDHKSDTRVE